jgi:hypothetical protein
MDLQVLLIIFFMYGMIVFLYGNLTFDFINGRLNERHFVGVIVLIIILHWILFIIKKLKLSRVMNRKTVIEILLLAGRSQVISALALTFFDVCSLSLKLHLKIILYNINSLLNFIITPIKQFY